MSQETKRFRVTEIVGELCMTLEQGDRVSEEINEALTKVDLVEVDFAGVRVLTAPFMNAAVGRTHVGVGGQDPTSRVQVMNVDESGQRLLARIAANAKEYYGGDDAWREAWDRAVTRGPMLHNDADSGED